MSLCLRFPSSALGQPDPDERNRLTGLIVLSKYIFYIYIVLYLTLVGASLKSVDVSGERTRSDIILGRLRTGIYTNMMVRTDHVWSCLILMIKVRSL